MGNHGIRHEQSGLEGARPVSLPGDTVIFMAGVQENCDLAEGGTALVRASDVGALNLSGTGTILSGLKGVFDQIDTPIVLHRVAEGVDDAATALALAGDSATKTGLWKSLEAGALTKSAPPKLLCVPKFSSAATVYAQIIAAADRLRAIAVMDGPSTDEADALTMAGDITDDHGRGYMVDPEVIAGGVAVPASPYVAGVIAKVDRTEGFWRSPSNHGIAGIEGTARAISHTLSGDGTEAGALNAGNVAAIVHRNGWKLWGNNGTGADADYQFLAVRRAADVIADQLDLAHEWAADKGLTATYLDEVEGTVNAFLRRLKSLGAIVDGVAWIDSAVNTPESLADGDLYVDYKFTPVYVANSITFRQRLTTEYLSQLFA
jgi:phage tail sheath protein FI